MRSFILLPLLVLITLSILSPALHGQIDCSQMDLVTPIEDSEVTLTPNIRYSSKANPAGGGNIEDLFLDIYTTGPSLTHTSLRPLIMVSHGGAFVGGEKEDMDALARYFAERGYVAVTHSYRLTNITQVLAEAPRGLQNAAIRATDDLIDAIEYMKTMADEYGIDTSHIVASGASAGAIMALNLAYSDAQDSMTEDIRNSFTDNGRVLSYPKENIQAVLNLSGAVLDTGWLVNNDIPVFSIHGEDDATVPYGSGQSFFVPVHGSGVIHRVLDRQGVNNILISVPEGGHTDIYDDERFLSFLEDYTTQASTALADIVCDPMSTSTDLVEGGSDPAYSIVTFPNPFHSELDIATRTTLKHIIIVDVLGKVVYSSTTPAIDHQEILRLDLSDLHSGSYYVQVIDTDNHVFTKKIIKQ